jgi:membrane-bound lytic murein transglycosylase D
MRRSWPVRASIALCCLLISGRSIAQTNTAAMSEAVRSVEESPAVARAFLGLPEESALSDGMVDVMQRSQIHYVEGSNLIKMGDSEKARESFNKAVDALLQSGLDLTSTQELNRFFQDLIRRIEQDESLYLLPPDDSEEGAENAVLDELGAVNLIPISIDPSLQDAVVADLADTSYDIPIMLNENVLKSLDFWLSRGRTLFEGGIFRSGRYRSMIERIFREEFIPLDLMYLAQVESLFKTNAVSRARAKGIWQFTEPTAKRYGLKVNTYIDERSDPEKSTRAAAHYLNELYGMFKDWNLVLAAYNWGEGNVKRLIERSGLKDFWELVNMQRKIPNETKNHVPLIMASIILGKNPEKYGLPSNMDSALEYQEVSVSKSIDLRAAAKILEISFEKLKELNPALRGTTTPANYPDFRLKVPIESSPGLFEKIASLPVVKPKPVQLTGNRYMVQRGDTLSAIAAQYRVTVNALINANGGISPKSLRAGQYLNIPSNARSSATTAKKPASQTASAPVPVAGNRYKVQRGDTLSEIASRYRVTVNALISANSGISPRALKVGQYLNIPSTTSNARSSSAGAKTTASSVVASK